jgi:hypothetical protein
MIRTCSPFTPQRVRRALAAAAASILTLGILSGSALAEHPADSAARAAIGRVLITRSIRSQGGHLGRVELSTKGPFALAGVTGSKTLDAGWILMTLTDRRWIEGPVISDEGLICDQAPAAAISDLHLLHFADGDRCSGPYPGRAIDGSSCRAEYASPQTVAGIEAAWRDGDRYAPLPTSLPVVITGRLNAGLCGSTEYALANLTPGSDHGLSTKQLDGLQDRGIVFKRAAGHAWVEEDLGNTCGGAYGVPSVLGRAFDACEQ